MKNLLLSLLCISCLLIEATNIENAADLSQGFSHPKIMSIGDSGIAYYGAENGVNINPALLAKYQGWYANFYSLNFENALDYRKINGQFSFLETNIGLSYITNIADDIPTTKYIDKRVRQNGNFSESITQLRLSFARRLNNLFILKNLDLGYSLGIQRYTFNNDIDYYNKIGLLLSLYNLDNFYIGATYEDDISYGLSYILPQYSLIVDYKNSGLRGGINYKYNEIINFSGGMNKDYITVGTGIFYNSLYGLIETKLGLSIDFVYMIPRDDLANEPLAYTSFTIKEIDRLSSPVIYTYPSFTKKSRVLVTGWAPRNSIVWLYINGKILVKTNANGNGSWHAYINIKQKTSKIEAKSTKSKGQRESRLSKAVFINLDNTVPITKYSAVVKGNKADFTFTTNEDISLIQIISNKYKQDVPLYMGNYKLTLNKEELEQHFQLELDVIDLAGNKSNYQLGNPFIRSLQPLQPLQQHIVTYKDQYMFSGQLNPASELMIYSINQYKAMAKTDKYGRFKHIIPLSIGKNKVELSLKNRYGVVVYPYQIIRLHKFKDINEDNFNRLATIGVIKPTPYFRPNSQVSQPEALYALAKLKELSELDTLDSIYKFAFENKWIKNENSYKLLSRQEAIDLVVKALAIDVYTAPKEKSYFTNIPLTHPYLKTINYFVENGFINYTSKKYEISKFITKKEFFNWLTRTTQLATLYRHYFN